MDLVRSVDLTVDCSVIVEHAKGTPHGEDYRRDRERGYDLPPRRSGGRGEKFVIFFSLVFFSDL